jgi:hypothetical protein
MAEDIFCGVFGVCLWLKVEGCWGKKDALSTSKVQESEKGYKWQDLYNLHIDYRLHHATCLHSKRNKLATAGYPEFIRSLLRLPNLLVLLYLLLLLHLLLVLFLVQSNNPTKRPNKFIHSFLEPIPAFNLVTMKH